MTRDETQLYAIHHEHGYVKIGKSNTPKRRLNSLQAGSPYDLRLLTTITVVGEWGLVESAIHESYEDRVVRGEWFDLPKVEITNLVELETIDSQVVERMPEFTPTAYVLMAESEKNRWLMDGTYRLITGNDKR